MIIRKTVSEHNKRNKLYHANDLWLNGQKKLARIRFDKARRPDGTIDVSQLPKLYGSNPKLEKSNDGSGHLTTGQSFAPSWVSGYNMCSFASGCSKICLNHSGHGQKHMMNGENHFVTQARLMRTWFYKEFPAQYREQVTKEMKSHIRKAKKLEAFPAHRPNNLSDELWEKIWPELFDMFPEVLFYDYTAVPNRNIDHIPNYHLVFSRKEDNEDLAFSQTKYNISACFAVKKGDPLPKEYKGKRVVDGDMHDMIWKWKEAYPNEQVVIGLRPKGQAAWLDTSGFVIPTNADGVVF